jgi:hypothetical protein
MNQNRVIRMATQKNRRESRLYFPLCQTLKQIFDRYYVADSYAIDRKTGFQRGPINAIQNPHLEITAYGKFTDKLQSKFSYYLFQKLHAEKFHPDLMGFVKKKPSSNEEFITAEIKKGTLRIRDILQAKLYEDIFDARFSFAISPKGISQEKLKVILEHDEAIRGKVIIAQCSGNGSSIRINPLLKNHIPKVFSDLCRFQ